MDGRLVPPRIVDQVMRDQARRRHRAATLCLQVEDGAIDDLQRVAVTNLRVGLDVRDQQLDRAQVAGDRLAQPAGEYEGNRLECCVPGA